MLNFEEYLKEHNKASEKSEALLIVDVQESFDKFMTEDYVNAVFEFCEDFDRVYQVWDSINQNEPSWTFPNQVGECSKEYGDLEIEHFDEFFNEIDIERHKTIFENPSKGDKMYCKDGSVWLYVGEMHTWFWLKKDLENFLKSIKEFDESPTIVGGSSEECLEDLIVACEHVGLSPKLDYRYIYSATFCPKGR